MMERVMSAEDKIKRAEEIYNRRRTNEYKTTNARVRVDNISKEINPRINYKLKKMIIQIIICMLIYLTFHYIINNDYTFSQEVKNKCEEILAYDISFSEMYESVSQFVISIKQKYKEMVEKVETNSNKENNEKINTNEESEEGSNIETEEEKSNINEEENESELESENSQLEETKIDENENIGGAIEEIVSENDNSNENLSEEDQMKKDAEYIKSKINFIKPLEGTITSRFGWRNPTVSTVSKYHTGIDIAANKGTDIISATNGKVILASSEGAYGNHINIQIEDIVIIYAHCLSLLVEENSEITQGQIIAKVGSTGNSTGPHLHFEIRREGRYVNPDLILDF